MAYRIGKLTYPGEPTAALLLSEVDVRDAAHSPWPGSFEDRHAGLPARAAQDAGTWPTVKLQATDEHVEAKLARGELATGEPPPGVVPEPVMAPARPPRPRRKVRRKSQPIPPAKPRAVKAAPKKATTRKKAPARKVRGKK